MFKADQNYEVDLRILTNNAQGNGSSKNSVDAYFTEKESLDPAIGLEVVLRVDGNALIVESNGPQYKTVTDGNGKAHINITNDESGPVIVTAFVFSDPNQNASTSINFTEVSSGFRIKEAINKNHSMAQGHPSIAWKGASFIISTEGGSGNITWEVKGAIQEIIVEGNDLDRSAGVTIMEKPNQPCVIIATDTLSNESSEYVFSISDFIQPMTTKKVTLGDAIKAHGSSILSPFDYRDLFTEWGDMSAYSTENWKADLEYWSSEYHSLGKATVANLEFGTLRETDHIGFIYKYYAFKIGA